jgi:hypothetical protein
MLRPSGRPSLFNFCTDYEVPERKFTGEARGNGELPMNDARRYRMREIIPISHSLSRRLGARWHAGGHGRTSCELERRPRHHVHTIEPTAISSRSGAPVASQGYLMSSIGIALAVAGCVLFVVTLLASVGLLAAGLGLTEPGLGACSSPGQPMSVDGHFAAQ